MVWIDRFRRIQRALRADRPLHPSPHVCLRLRDVLLDHEEHNLGRLRLLLHGPRDRACPRLVPSARSRSLSSLRILCRSLVTFTAEVPLSATRCAPQSQPQVLLPYKGYAAGGPAVRDIVGGVEVIVGEEVL